MRAAALFKNQFTFDFFRHSVVIDNTKPVHKDYEINSPYKLLGVKRNAPDGEIKRAWRKLMMANHPDLGGDIDKTMAINAAYKDICKRRGV